MRAMPEVLQRLISILESASQSDIDPRTVRSDVSSLSNSAGSGPIDVLWERDPGGRLRYDAVMQLASGSSLSLGVAAPSHTPVAFRSAHRFEDSQLLRVDGIVLTFEEAAGLIDPIWNDLVILRKLVHLAIARRWVARLGLRPSDEDIQETLDSFRRTHGLHSVARTESWMREHGMTHASLEARAEDLATAALLRRTIVSGSVDGWYETNFHACERIIVDRMEAKDQRCAERFAAALSAGEDPVSWIADRLQHESADRSAQLSIQMVVPVQCRAKMSNVLDRAAVGAVVGPLELDGMWVVIRVRSRHQGTLDDETRGTIEDALFESWLDEQAAQANVEWFWGRAPESAFTERE